MCFLLFNVHVGSDNSKRWGSMRKTSYTSPALVAARRRLSSPTLNQWIWRSSFEFAVLTANQKIITIYCILLHGVFHKIRGNSWKLPIPHQSTFFLPTSQSSPLLIVCFNCFRIDCPDILSMSLQVSYTLSLNKQKKLQRIAIQPRKLLENFLCFRDVCYLRPNFSPGL